MASYTVTLSDFVKVHVGLFLLYQIYYCYRFEVRYDSTMVAVRPLMFGALFSAAIINAFNRSLNRISVVFDRLTNVY